MPINDSELRTAVRREKSFKIYDGKGLHALVPPTGSIRWRFRYQFNGRELQLSLGTYPLITLSEARKKRDQMRKLLLNGFNPSEQRKNIKRKALVLSVEEKASFIRLKLNQLEKILVEIKKAI